MEAVVNGQSTVQIFPEPEYVCYLLSRQKTAIK